MLADVPAATWQAYLRYQTIDSVSPFLSDAFAQENYSFYGKTLDGQAGDAAALEARAQHHQRPDGRSAGQGVRRSGVLPGSQGAHADPGRRTCSDALKTRIEGLDWMGDDTKAKALEKWAAFTPKIGYPDKWRDWSGLATSRDSYVGNLMAAAEFNYKFEPGQDRPAGGQDRMGHEPADGERLLQPAGQRDRVPGRDPAAAVLRPQRRRRGELRRHRRGDRPRDDPRLRRPGQPLRRQGQLRRTGGATRTRPASSSCTASWSSSSTATSPSTASWSTAS